MRRRMLLRAAAICVVCLISSALAGFAADSGNQKKIERGRSVVRELLERVGSEADDETRENIREVLTSIKNLREPPIPPTYDFFEVPGAFAARLRSGIGHGDCEATNLDFVPGKDVSALDPRASSFWRRPKAISDLDLYHGFGRTSAESLDSTIWRYAGPKLGSGANPGFQAKAGGIRIRVKFAETKSEPFASRIFWALGYHVDPTCYCPALKLLYDRRLFEEFNSREPISTQFRFAGVLPLYTLKMQKQHDPFNFIAHAVMKDGRRLSGASLKRELLGASATPRWIFRPEVEEQIEYLVTVPANLQLRDKWEESIGPWRFDELGHADRRELRGTGLLAAWLGWYDCRKENTRLRVVRQSGSVRLLHYFSDLGAGLGKANAIFSGKGELPNEFGWTFTAPEKVQGPGRMTIPFRITNYRPIEHNEAFERMTVNDARWMARLIAQLTERQIADALSASGFDAPTLEVYLEKLTSRRDRMLRDLGLEREFVMLRP